MATETISHFSPFVKNEELMNINCSPDCQTYFDAFLEGLKISEKLPCYGTWSERKQEFEWITYGEVEESAGEIGSALVTLAEGQNSQADRMLGLLAQNSLEWGLCQIACYMHSGIIVPLYPTQTRDAVHLITKQAGFRVALVDSVKNAELILSAKSESLKCLIVSAEQHVAAVTRLANETANQAIRVISVSQLRKLGREKPHQASHPSAENVATICYTSGATGSPKGAILKHGNYILGLLAMEKHAELKMSSADVLLSSLPLALAFEQLNHLMMLRAGGRIGFAGAENSKLLDYAHVLRPTYLPVVPATLSRLIRKIKSSINENIVKKISFDFAYNRKLQLLREGSLTRNSFWDNTMFSTAQAALGGRARLMVTGAAPSTPEMIEFARVVFGCKVIECYGQTEVAAAAFCTLADDFTTGHVGFPIPCNEVKLVDVAELNFFARNDEGEVCIRGGNCSVGYLHDDELTGQLIDADGWLHSGDIGRWQKDGKLKIIDRKEHIIKLSQGECIAPERLESVYGQSTTVAFVFVDGNSNQDHPVAVVVPEAEVVSDWISGRRMSVAEALQSDGLKQLIVKSFRELEERAQLKDFEKVRKIALFQEPFTVENQLLTVTSKNRRPTLRQKFADAIDQLYSSPAPNSAAPISATRSTSASNSAASNSAASNSAVSNSAASNSVASNSAASKSAASKSAAAPSRTSFFSFSSLFGKSTNMEKDSEKSKTLRGEEQDHNN